MRPVYVYAHEQELPRVRVVTQGNWIMLRVKCLIYGHYLISYGPGNEVLFIQCRKCGKNQTWS